MTKKVTVYLDDRAVTQLNALTSGTGKTKKEIVREAIDTQWAKARQLAEPDKRRPRDARRKSAPEV
jgi:predicted DNA-binding protein